MRKYQQKKFLEMLGTLEEAGGEIKRLFSRGDFSGALAMLGECQGFAVTMGGYIEGIAGEGTRTVAALEGYCNLLYAAALEAETKNSGGNALKALKKQIVKIEGMAREELVPDRFEAVFFPYKASMWDTFETVWREAAADPACDVYVVPLPYYTCGSDGMYAGPVFEAAEYPEYVPVTDWRQYDVKARRPDIIFIHNPFDEYNTTTRLPEEYYSRNLREHTDMLVYIPYYVSFPYVGKDHSVLPATIYVKWVFVQSEQDRSIHVRENKRWLKENGYVVNAAEIDRRFVVAGSPKLDKALGARPEAFATPPDWERLVAKPDGSRKKVVFLNSTIAAFLDDTERYIKKLRYILDTFRGRDDVLLWWRPHPLIQTTAAAMRKEGAGEYAQIVDDYRRAGFGIYDDGPDPHRAIALCDAYYGDGGSMAPMFQATGKPMLLQNMDVTGNRRLAFSAVCEAEGTLWAAEAEFNALYKIDAQTMEARYAGSFPGEKERGSWLYSHILCHGGVLYFAPFTAGAIAVYNPSSGVFERIRLPAAKMQDETRPKFTKIVAARGRLFFIPAHFPGILVLDPVTRELGLIDGWLKLFEPCENAKLHYFSDVVADQGRGCLILASPMADIIVALDLGTSEATARSGGDDKGGYLRIVPHGDAAWLLMRNRPGLARLDMADSAIAVYELEPDGKLSEDAPAFQSLYAAGDDFYLLPFNNHKIVRFSLSENIFSVVAELTAPKYRVMRTNTTGIYLQDNESRFYVFSPETGHVSETYVTLGGLEDRIALDAYLKGSTGNKPDDSILYEEPILRTLDAYLDAIAGPGLPAWLSAPSQGAAGIANADGGAGKKIYEFCRREALRP